MFGVVFIKKPVWISLTVIFSILLIGTVYAVWSQTSEVKFRITISQSDHGCGDCTGGFRYQSINEGIQLLRQNAYTCLYQKMERYRLQLEARITELNELPFGGITNQKLQDECNRYRNVDIAGFGDCINKYGDLINELATFYNNSSQKEKDEVPDFWTQRSSLWDLRTQLWNKRQGLYNVVDDVWSAGRAKIDYKHGG